jgi:cytochrome c553
MRLARAVLPLALVLAAAPVALAAGDVAAGRERAQVCAGCHGEQGVSSTEGVPSLAGQTDSFLQWQLVFFRSERRQNPIMTPLAADLSDEEVRNLGAYFASLPKPGRAEEAKADPTLQARGREVAAEHRCANCHMDDFHGKQAAANIANQREDYLAKALTDYRSATRPSTGLAAMTEAASSLSDDDIKALAHYLATL